MGSEAKTTSDHLPETPSPTVSELISELKTCFSSINFQNATKILMNREQDLLNKTHFLENEKDEILKENKKLNDLLKKKDAKIESLEKEKDAKIESLEKENDVKIESLKKENDVKIESLKKEKDVKIKSLKKENDVKIESLKKEKDVKIESLKKEKDAKIESLEKENEGLKDEVKKKQNEIGVHEKKFLDLDGKVSSLEKLSKELLGWGDHSVDLEVKNPKNVVGEGSRPPPPPGFEEILDPKPKKERDSKVPEIIAIDDDDDDDDDDPGDRDLMKVSSKRKRDEIKRDDSDDDKCISFLRRKKVSKVTQDHKKDNYDNKIPTRTSHLKSPFCDSSSSDSDNEITKMSAKISLPKDRWETREDMVKEFAKNDQLCLNAICALHKQDASQKHVVLVRPFDAYRISSLSRKKTLSELSSFDLHQCRQFAMDYSDKLFDIYKEKSDTFFPAL